MERSKVILAVMVLVGAGACGGASVLTSHEPMHPGNSQSFTIRAVSSGSVDRVELQYERSSLSVGGGGTLVETVVDPMSTVKTCDPSGTVSSLTCEHTFASGFPANSLIDFRATAVDGNGNSRSETYTFAAGDYPLPNDPIPIRVKGGTSNKLDVVFIPDTDITLANFRNNLDEVIDDLYFKYDLIRTWRGNYNFYYSGVQGDYEELCNFTNPSNMANLTAVADAVLILHQTDLRDCRSGVRISSEIDYDKTLIHETGHVLYGLQDEYCCDSSYSPQSCAPNLWSSLAACQADASSIGYPASNCAQLVDGANSLNFWRIDPAGSTGCMMGDAQHNSGSDFAKACEKRILHRYGKCGGGDCFPAPDCP